MQLFPRRVSAADDAAAAASVSVARRQFSSGPAASSSPARTPLLFGIFFSASLLLCSGGAATTANAQNILEGRVAPPPLRLVSPVEREQLTRETDSKKRLRTAMELAEVRLRQAEQMTTAGRNQAATDELAAYQGLLEDALAALRARGPAGKSRDLYKRLELTIRPHGVRLEAIRRATPSEYAVHVKSVYEFTRDARTEALNSFYGETVLRERRPTENDAAATATPGGRTPAAQSPAAREGEMPRP